MWYFKNGRNLIIRKKLTVIKKWIFHVGICLACSACMHVVFGGVNAYGPHMHEKREISRGH